MAKNGLPVYGIIILLLALMIALAAAAYMYLQNQQATAENENLKAEMSVLKNRLNGTQALLNMTQAELSLKNKDVAQKAAEIENLTLLADNQADEIEDLRGELNESENELEETKNMLSEAKGEILQIETDAHAMSEEINESIKWFRDNSILPSTLKVDRFVNKVERGCEEEGVLRLACISYMMEEELGFSYKYDPTGDRLYSIDEIISRKGGDCEDYALFFKAMLNRLKEDDFEIEGWTAGTSEYIVYEDNDTGKYWYYEMADGISLGNTRESNPYAVCYFYDVSGEESIGHCVIMLTNRTIESPDDISTANLMDSPLFEPQDGQYLGKIGDEFSACTDGEYGCDEQTYSLIFIITDSDLFQFSNGKWNYYEGYGKRIDVLLEELGDILAG